MEAIIFCGIPGCGKSTYFRERFFQTHVRISLDLLRTRSREDILLYACLSARQAFVVDNTNVSRDTRQRYLRLAVASGFRCVLYYFDTTLEDALQRNSERSGRHRVPEIAIRGMFAKLNIPTLSEGFDDSFRLRIIENKFQVEKLS